MAASIDGAATLNVSVRDVNGRLEAELGDEAQLLERGVFTTMNRVDYALQSVNSDGHGLLTLVFEDVVKWQMSQRTRFTSMQRGGKKTFPRFAERLVQEASAPPLARIRFYCPELGDAQPVPAPKIGEAGRDRGTGADSSFKVKGQLADAGQRRTIDLLLSEARRMGASARVMVGVIMAATQESVMGKKKVSASGRHHGTFHQDDSYGTVSQRMNDTRATNGFLRRWAARNGSIKTVRGDLATAVEKVQVSGFAAGYRQWEKEASRTVEAWGEDPSGGSVNVVEPYEFTRGTKNGEEQTSWDSIGGYASQRNWRRWAFLNTFYLVSEEELRAAAASLTVDGNEEWLLSLPSWDWAPRRSTGEVRIRVLAERWGVHIGAVVRLDTGAPSDGRYLVTELNGAAASPELEVVLRRPVAKKAEPRNSTHEQSRSGGFQGELSGSTGSAVSVARGISSRGYPYVWGGGHGAAGKPSGSPPGYDCSGATVAFLAALGHGFRPGGPTATSGGLMSWGVAGQGQVYTVWANPTHVFVEFPDGSRLDTSPHGDGPSGARYRTTKRSTAGFTPRHWRGS